MKHIKRMYLYIMEFVKTAAEDNIGMYAAQASFFVSLSSIPFVMLLLALLKYFVPINSWEVQNFAAGYFPQTIDPLIRTVLSEIFNSSSDISIISLTAITTLWLSSGGFMAIHSGLNKIYDVEKKKNYFYRRFVSMLYTLCFLLTLLFSFLLFAFGNRIHYFLHETFPFLPDILSDIIRARVFIFALMLTLIFALFYTFIPYKKIKFIKQLPGAVFSAAGWCVFSYAYSVYIEYFSNYSYVYGSLTAIVFLMLWLYFCMWIFLYGAEINKMIWQRN